MICAPASSSTLKPHITNSFDPHPHMPTSPVILPIYEHPLIPSPRFICRNCDGCQLYGVICGGYYYVDLENYVWFHKECAEAPLKINHPSHPQHPLLRGHDEGDCRCDVCLKNWWPGDLHYSCQLCEFKVDLACALRKSPPAEVPTCHDHPLVLLKKREKEDPCEVCKYSINGFSYSCLECDVHFHAKCLNLSKEVNHPCHSAHPLKLVTCDSLSNDAEKNCILCGRVPENIIYHCSICNFTTCLDCTKNPPPLVIDHTKTHKHPLTLFPKDISCACNVCGKQDKGMPYACLQCGFMVHGGCIDLPRVININRHDDRISFTHHLGPGYSKCGVCRESISPYYGAYTCSVCPNYAVHPRCATRSDVWDGVELEGIPEDTEDIAPFKVVGDNLIIHRFHPDHALRLHEESIIHDECARCEACVHPVRIGSIYSCEECSFILHKRCASLPLKKRLVFNAALYSLGQNSNAVVLECKLCGIYRTGYMYIVPNGSFVDVHCASLSEPFISGGHPHPLYFDRSEGHLCDACEKEICGFALRCDDCDFDLGLCCASLPEKIKHRNDEHPLTLCWGDEKSNGRYWCDICETELDPSKWSYACSDCGVTLHTECVVGDFSSLKPGRIVGFKCDKFEVVSNNHNTRPLCSWCHSRCKVNVILKFHGGNTGYVCSRSCLWGWLEHQK